MDDARGSGRREVRALLADASLVGGARVRVARVDAVEVNARGDERGCDLAAAAGEVEYAVVGGAAGLVGGREQVGPRAHRAHERLANAPVVRVGVRAPFVDVKSGGAVRVRRVRVAHACESGRGGTRGSGARQSRALVRSETGNAVEADVVARHIARTRHALRRFPTHTITTRTLDARDGSSPRAAESPPRGPPQVVWEWTCYFMAAPDNP